MASFNRVIIAGNLTRDPEHKIITSGQAVCRLGIASNRQFKNRQTGSMVQEVCYVDVEVWGQQADSCRQYLQKGRPVLIEGRLKLDTWEDQTGQKKSKHSIVADRIIFLGANNGNSMMPDAPFVSSTMDDMPSNDMQLNPNNPVERDLMAQLEKAQNRIKQSKNSSLNNAMGEIEFNDQPPFEEQLPF